MKLIISKLIFLRSTNYRDVVIENNVVFARNVSDAIVFITQKRTWKYGKCAIATVNTVLTHSIVQHEFRTVLDKLIVYNLDKTVKE